MVSKDSFEKYKIKDVETAMEHMRVCKDPYELNEFAKMALGDDTLDVFKAYLDNPLVDPNTTNCLGETLLFRACVRNHPKSVDLLLAHPKTDINMKTDPDVDSECSILMYLSAFCDKPSDTRDVFLQKLLKRPEIKLNDTDFEGHTALNYAAQNFAIKPFKMLLQCPEVDVNRKFRDNSILMYILIVRLSLIADSWDDRILAMVECLFTRPDFKIESLEQALSFCTNEYLYRSKITEFLVDLIKRFDADPHDTSIEMKAKHGMLPNVELFCILEFKGRGVRRLDDKGIVKFKRVFDRLPTELKMRACNLAHGINSEFITQKEIDYVMKYF